ncbi:ferredoxin reductase-like protein [Backusella circina FSU 941]|nr:ferredoxin reductase-like protein [Backusella circina FSU 941]
MGFSSAEFKPFKLEKVERVNHNVKLFRFSTQNNQDGLPVASCVLFRHVDKESEHKEVIRPYTPTAMSESHVDFIIKDYAQGNMSRHLHTLQIGDEVEMKGPIMKYNWQKKPVDHVGMIAAGTGITPMLQFIRKEFSSNSSTTSKFTLIYANKEEQDILFREELTQLVKEHPDRFKVVYVLENAGQHWQAPMGYVTEDLINQYIPSASLVFVCGPPPFMEMVSGDKNPDKSQGPLKGYLKRLGYKQDCVCKL